MFATRSFSPGETVLQEDPMVSAQFVWNAEYGYRACHYCLEPLETAMENVHRLANDTNIILPRMVRTKL